MKSFRTELTPRGSSFQISHRTPVLTIGSCFSDSIGDVLIQNKFATLANPMGNVYNPLSIHQILGYIIHNEPPSPSLYVESQDTWRNYAFHSSLSAPSRSDAERMIANSVGIAHHFLKDAACLIITYGSARVFRLAATGEVVANCHKMPGSNFKAQWLTPDEILDSFDLIYNQIKLWKPDLRIILTVSPVRHIRESLELNSVSKSILRWTCHQLTETFRDVEYFPAYELMMDDLRDYRFYADDMIHPSQDAIQYIWEKFANAYFSTTTRNLIGQWTEVSAALSHRPFHSQTPAHQKFLQETLLRLEELKSRLPVEEELEQLKSQLLHTHD